MTPRARNALVVGWALFAAWVFVRYGLRLGLLLYAELGLGMDTNIVDRDFANYWGAGRLVLEGKQSLLFDQPAYYEWLKSIFGEQYRIHAWSYPPHFLPLVAPLGFLEYRPALIAFLVITCAFFVWAAAMFVRRYASGTSRPMLFLALAGFVFLQIETTQNGFLTSGLLLATLAFMRDRPALGGLFLALLTVKPQLGFLVPLLALLDRNWRLLGWATLFSVALIAVSTIWFGVDSWRAYFNAVLPYQQHVITHWRGEFLYMMPGVFGVARALGTTPAVALQIQLAMSVVAFAILLWVLFTTRDPLERAFAILAGTFLVSPYAFNYDMGAMSVAAACLACRARDEERYAAMGIFGVLAVLPAAVSPLAMQGLPIAPLALVVGLAMLWWQARRPAMPAGIAVNAPS